MKHLIKHLFRNIFIFFVIGGIYTNIELIWRGVTYLPMLFIGGLSGIIVGSLNHFPLFSKLRMYQECIIGTITTLIIEYTSGYILNVQLHMNIWNYKNLPFNLDGQICLYYGILWFMLIPFGIWLDDYLKYKFFNEGKQPILTVYYKNLITFK
jgi:uncharacterized membrane protein